MPWSYEFYSIRAQPRSQSWACDSWTAFADWWVEAFHEQIWPRWSIVWRKNLARRLRYPRSRRWWWSCRSWAFLEACPCKLWQTKSIQDSRQRDRKGGAKPIDWQIRALSTILVPHRIHWSYQVNREAKSADLGLAPDPWGIKQGAELYCEYFCCVLRLDWCYESSLFRTS